MRLLHDLKNRLLLQPPDEISEDKFDLFEFFLVILYTKTCNIREVNEARWILFSRNNKVIEKLLPTKGALRQHVLRSVLQKWSLSFEKTLMAGMLANGVGKK